MAKVQAGSPLPFGDMGPCEIVWGYGESGAAYLGKFLGGMKVTKTTNVSKVHEEQRGDAAVNAVYTGSELSVEIPLTRLTREQIATVLMTDLDENGNIPIKNQVGCDLYSQAKAMVIKPICGDEVSEDPSEWILLYKTVPQPGLDLTFDRSTQRTLPTTFLVFISQESGEEGVFGTLGMESGSTEFGLEPLL